VAGQASTIPYALHPHRLLLDQPSLWRWFALLTDKLIRRGVHTSVKALEDDITAWIDTWNLNPRPFTWTKAPDEILNSLADYLAKIGAGHQKTEQN
jgi:hypothetical protein